MEGIIENRKEEAIADFLINEGYEAFNVVPICCVATGSHIQGLAVKGSEQEYLGVHLMNTWDILEHPDFRPRAQVLHQKFDENLDSIPMGSSKSSVSLDSFEVWKFISLYLRGSFVAYELLYLPSIFDEQGADGLFSLMREGVTNRVGKAARSYAMHEWAKHKASRKKAVVAYYRLMQAVMFLREGTFEWDIGNLLDYMEKSGIVSTGKVVIGKYAEREMRTTPITQLEEVGYEIHRLIDEVDKAGVTTLLPDQVPKEVLEAILQGVKRSRSAMI